ncbi:MAG: hypothetical protein FWC93_00490 [Defluviitaleaceae bacterium]|nr:hypothetical protein [Defluviitaleaceae bacterium]
MLRLTVIFSALFVLLVLSSCSGTQSPAIYVPLVFQNDTAHRNAHAQSNEATPLRLKIEIENHRLARHEPASGALLGVYVARDRTISGIREFEREVGVNHAIFAYTTTLGDDYPLLWVLEAIAAQKSPFITLLPPEDGYIYDLELLADFAASAGRFNVPVFVQLYPIAGNHGFSPAEYIPFFRAARDIFAQHAPNTALVWGFDAENMGASTRFYPGAEAVDWIKMTVYNNISTDGTFGDPFTYINFFHYAFQQEAPLMLGTAVSHHTTLSNTYFTRAAADKITDIYGQLTEYPRIKAVIYRNYSDPGGSGNKYGINSIEIIRTAYAAAVTNQHFIDFVSLHQGNRMAAKTIRSPFRAMIRGAYFYIPEKALIYDARFPYMDMLHGKEVSIDGDVFFSIADVNSVSGADFFVDLERGMLVLR